MTFHEIKERAQLTRTTFFLCLIHTILKCKLDYNTFGATLYEYTYTNVN